MGLVSAIPLPLRIAAGVVLVVALYGLVTSVGGGASLFGPLALALWIVVLVVLFHEFGWLDFLGRVPVLSGTLAFIANRDEAIRNTGETEAPRGALSEDERERLLEAARGTLASLRGIDTAQRVLAQRLLEPAENDETDPFATQASAVAVLFAGPRGVGKTTVARCAANVLTGLGALDSARIVTLKETELRSGQFRSASELGRLKAEEAVGGTLLLDDADWLVADSRSGSSASPGVDVGLAILEVLQRHPRECLVALTLGPDAAERLRTDTAHARWLGKLTVKTIGFEHLDAQALLDILDRCLATTDWRLADDSARRSAERLLDEVRARRTEAFDNADACRRIAEQLVEIATSEGGIDADTRQISRHTVGLLDDELE